MTPIRILTMALDLGELRRLARSSSEPDPTPPAARPSATELSTVELVQALKQRGSGDFELDLTLRTEQPPLVLYGFLFSLAGSVAILVGAVVGLVMLGLTNKKPEVPRVLKILAGSALGLIAATTYLIPAIAGAFSMVTIISGIYLLRGTDGPVRHAAATVWCLVPDQFEKAKKFVQQLS